MSRLPPEWVEHLASGVSHRMGSCSASGRPAICRAIAADVEPDGRLLVLATRRAAAQVLDAIAETGQVAASFARPQTHRTLHVKGRDAQVAPAQAEHRPLLEARREAFMVQLAPYGFTREQLMHTWYAVHDGDLFAVRFTPGAAWDQTPGPGAGNAVVLLP